MKIKKIISLLGAAVVVASSFGTAVAVAESDMWDKYTAAYDYNGRLVSVFKTENIDPTAENTDSFKMLKDFIWNEKNEPYMGESTVTLEAINCGEIKRTSDGYQLQVYEDENSTLYSMYNISESPELYVNGVKTNSWIARDFEELFNGQYVKANAMGKVRLTETGTPDGVYDVVSISYYVDGVVDAVDDSGKVIVFDTYDTSIDRGEIVFDGTHEYSIKFNGKEITPNEIKEGDVLSIAYDVSDSFRYSKSYDIYVSRNKTSAMITSINDNYDPLKSEYIADDGKIYNLAYEGAANLKVGTSYELYLNISGKISKKEEKLGVDKYGLLENVYKSNDGADAFADIIGSNGKVTTYQIDMNDYDELLFVLMYDMDKVDSADKLANRRPYNERVIEYDTDLNGTLIIKSVAEARMLDGEFNEYTYKLGGVQISPEYTVVFDMTEYKPSEVNSCPVLPTDYFSSNMNYVGCAFGCKGSKKTHQFVFIENAEEIKYEPVVPWEDAEAWAVFVRNTSVQTANGESAAIEAYVNGELIILPIKEGINSDLTEGDIFFYKMNPDYEIEEINPVSSMKTIYRDYYETALSNSFDVINAETANKFVEENNDKGKCKIVSGAIVDVSSYNSPYIGIVLADAEGLKRDYQSIDSFSIDYAKEYDVSKDVRVYMYDYSVKDSHRLSIASSGAVTKSTFDRSSYIGDKLDGVVDFNAEFATISQSENPNFGNVNFAVAKVVNNEITEILVIIPDEKENIE